MVRCAEAVLVRFSLLDWLRTATSMSQDSCCTPEPYYRLADCLLAALCKACQREGWTYDSMMQPGYMQEPTQTWHLLACCNLLACNTAWKQCHSAMPLKLPSRLATGQQLLYQCLVSCIDLL